MQFFFLPNDQHDINRSINSDEARSKHRLFFLCRLLFSPCFSPWKEAFPQTDTRNIVTFRTIFSTSLFFFFSPRNFLQYFRKNRTCVIFQLFWLFQRNLSGQARRGERSRVYHGTYEARQGGIPFPSGFWRMGSRIVNNQSKSRPRLRRTKNYSPVTIPTRPHGTGRPIGKWTTYLVDGV